MRYVSDPRETIQHSAPWAAPTADHGYNNPVAYSVDITPEMFARWRTRRISSRSRNPRATCRITDILNTVGTRYDIFTGRRLALESLMIGASAGRRPGLRLPLETVAIHKLVAAGRIPEALRVYRWFMRCCTRRLAALRPEREAPRPSCAAPRISPSRALRRAVGPMVFFSTGRARHMQLQPGWRTRSRCRARSASASLVLDEAQRDVEGAAAA